MGTMDCPCERIIYIAGSGRSGSSLLDLMLNSHSNIVGLGEAHRASLSPTNRTCSCGASLTSCPFWGKIFDNVEEKYLENEEQNKFSTTVLRDQQPRLSQLSVDAAALIGSRAVMQIMSYCNKTCRKYWESVRNSIRLYEEVAAVSGSSVVVDSSKNGLRMKLLSMRSPRLVRILYLVRDGRAVVHSMMKHYNLTCREASERWLSTNENIQMALHTLPDELVRLVHYEELCADTEATLRSLAEFAEVEYEESMSRPHPRNSHAIPGNRLFRRDERIEVEKRNSWRDDWSAEHQVVFDETAGALNRELGYN